MTEKNVRCNICGIELPCEQCRDEPEKFEGFAHLCYSCYKKGAEIPDKEKAHLCIPEDKLNEEYQKFLGEMAASTYLDMWESEKKRLKDLSRKELGQTCFLEGASFMLQLMRKMSQEGAEEEGK
jgi:hypothetical protein